MKLGSLFFLFTLFLFVVGCSVPQPQADQGTPSGKVGDVEGLGGGLTGLDTMDEEDLSDLEGLDKELDVDF
ncbi:hypothetical protein HYS50_03720 [Candidatus Woesearchaeota archaeon]|nr:hypothetical protein [Candidatus Woesearchaeota archaeon]